MVCQRHNSAEISELILKEICPGKYLKCENYRHETTLSIIFGRETYLQSHVSLALAFFHQ